MVTDASGNLYFADNNNHVVRKISTSGVVTTIAGNGTPDYTGDGGAATAGGATQSLFHGSDEFRPWLRVAKALEGRGGGRSCSPALAVIALICAIIGTACGGAYFTGGWNGIFESLQQWTDLTSSRPGFALAITSCVALAIDAPVEAVRRHGDNDGLVLRR
jgi:hypothetical protein